MMDPKSVANPRSAQAQGQVQIHPLLCKSCGLCAEYCPRELPKPATDLPPDQRTGAVINPAGHVVYVVWDPKGRCNGCGICAQVCPEGAVVVYRTAKPSPKPAMKEASNG